MVAVAEGIPFDALTESSVEKLYALKGAVVARGVKALTGIDMPVFEKRRFQHGAMTVEKLRERMPDARSTGSGQAELAYRRQFLAIYA